MPAPENPAVMTEPGTKALTPAPGSDFTPAMNAVLPRRRSPAWTLANCLTYGRLVAVPAMV
jgi:cardiolipin synthase